MMNVLKHSTPIAMAALIAAASATATAQQTTMQQPAPKAQDSAVPAQGEPNIRMMSREHDFGEITDEASVTATFEFINDGTAPLIVSNVRGGCGCTIPKLDKDVYQPGESGVVTVVFNPAKKKGSSRQKVTITSNDPDEPRAQVDIVASVKQLVTVTPPNVQLGKVFRGEDNSAVITVAGMKEDFRVIDARVVGVGGEHWKAEIGPFRPVETSNGIYNQGTITVRVKDDAPLGPLRGTMILRTNDERKGSLSITVAGRLAGDVSAMPERLSFGSMAGGETYKKRVELRSRTGDEFEITSVAFDGNREVDMDTEVQPGANGGWVVTIAMNAPEQTGIVRGDLVIRTSLESEPEIKLPMAGAIRR